MLATISYHYSKYHFIFSQMLITVKIIQGYKEHVISFLTGKNLWSDSGVKECTWIAKQQRKVTM